MQHSFLSPTLILATTLTFASGYPSQIASPSLTSEATESARFRQGRFFQNASRTLRESHFQLELSEIGKTSLSQKIAFLREKPQCSCTRCSKLDTLI